MSRIRRILLISAVALLVIFMAAWFERPGLREYHQQLITKAGPAHPVALTATWLGVTGLLVQDGRNAIMIDPFFSRPPGLLRMAFNREIRPDEAAIKDALSKLKIEKLDAVLISHSHYDHAMDAGVVARLTGAKLIGSESTLNIGRSAGLPESQLMVADTTQAQEMGNFQVRFLASEHAGKSGGAPTGNIDAPLTMPAHYLDYKLGGTYSILIDHLQGSLLHHGSAGFKPGALDGMRADVAFLSLAMIDELDIYLRETLDTVGATRVIPIHWDDFSRPLSKKLVPIPFVVRLDQFFEHMRKRRPSIRVETMLVNDPAVLFPNS